MNEVTVSKTGLRLLGKADPVFLFTPESGRNWRLNLSHFTMFGKSQCF